MRKTTLLAILNSAWLVVFIASLISILFILLGLFLFYLAIGGQAYTLMLHQLETAGVHIALFWYMAQIAVFSWISYFNYFYISRMRKMLDTHIDQKTLTWARVYSFFALVFFPIGTLLGVLNLLLLGGPAKKERPPDE